jgi:hypothetical protein
MIKNVVKEILILNTLVNKLNTSISEAARILDISRSTVKRRLAFTNEALARASEFADWTFGPGDLVNFEGCKSIILDRNSLGDFHVYDLECKNDNLVGENELSEFVDGDTEDDTIPVDEDDFIPVQCIILTESVVIVRNGIPLTIDKSYRYFNKIQDLMRTIDGGYIRQSVLDEIYKFIDLKNSLTEFSNGAVKVVKDAVYFNDSVVDGRIVHMLINEFAEGNDAGLKRFSEFLNKVMQSSSWKVRNRLYDFLENTDLQIDDQGRVLAFKVVQDNYLDKHSGTLDNSPGKVVEMDRANVDDRDEVTCSYGLHICSPGYIKSFYGNGDRIVSVAIEPQDFVSVPVDYNFTKARVCKYEVLDDITDEVLDKGWHRNYVR